MRSVLVVVGPVRRENLVGLAAEQEVELLLEEAVELFAISESAAASRGSPTAPPSVSGGYPR
jgi:hypothetical protein